MRSPILKRRHSRRHATSTTLDGRGTRTLKQQTPDGLRSYLPNSYHYYKTFCHISVHNVLIITCRMGRVQSFHLTTLQQPWKRHRTTCQRDLSASFFTVSSTLSFTL